ncbi:DUF1320 domain-containing protein [Parabacteroides sp. OttesenSCG-928-B22]|nr:DUF1320 domain-containing protein [Parabacteroides sp. OttesenSCG-928-B22]
MSAFIERKDYDATVHAEIIDSLTRKDDTIVEICEDRAIDQMKSYMEARYNVDVIFSMSGGDRIPLVLMMCLDIAVYHIYTAGNPQKLSQIRKDRYDRAIEWLKGVQKGLITISGAPLREDDVRNSASEYQMKSNPKRHNHF